MKTNILQEEKLIIPVPAIFKDIGSKCPFCKIINIPKANWYDFPVISCPHVVEDFEDGNGVYFHHSPKMLPYRDHYKEKFSVLFNGKWDAEEKENTFDSFNSLRDFINQELKTSFYCDMDGLIWKLEKEFVTVLISKGWDTICPLCSDLIEDCTCIQEDMGDIDFLKHKMLLSEFIENERFYREEKLK